MLVNVCLDGPVNQRTFCYQTWCGDADHEPEYHVEKNCLSLRSRSQLGLIISKYDSFYNVFWTADSSAAKLGTEIA